MKRIVIGTVLAIFIATVAFAKTSTISACTADKKLVVLTVELNDELITKHPVENHVALAFTAAANILTADDLISGRGEQVFAGGLDDADIEAIDGLTAPVITGSCN